MTNIERRNGNKSTGVAAGLSIIPGVGTMYAGSAGAGVLLVSVFALFGVLSFVGIGVPLLLWGLLYASGLGSAVGCAIGSNHRKTRY